MERVICMQQQGGSLRVSQFTGLSKISVMSTIGFLFLLLPSAASFTLMVHKSSIPRLSSVLYEHPPDHFDMDELKRRLAAETNPFSEMFEKVKTKPPKAEPETVYIVSFERYGQQPGIHSIEYPMGSGNNVVLAFESKQACDKFAASLRAQHFFDPKPTEFFMVSLDSFCRKLGVYVQLVPDGVELIPPSQNVPQLGRHNRSLREQQKHLNFVFSMADGAEFEEEGLFDMAVGTFE